MKKIHLLTITALAAVIALPLNAAEKTKSKPAASAAASASPAAAETKTKSLPFRGKIASVDNDKKSITLESKSGEGRTLMVGSSAQIFKGDGTTAASWDDLKTGEEVRGSYTKADDGSMQVVKIKVGAKPEGETKSAKKAEKKEAK